MRVCAMRCLFCVVFLLLFFNFLGATTAIDHFHNFFEGVVQVFPAAFIKENFHAIPPVANTAPFTVTALDFLLAASTNRAAGAQGHHACNETVHYNFIQESTVGTSSGVVAVDYRCCVWLYGRVPDWFAMNVFDAYRSSKLDIWLGYVYDDSTRKYFNEMSHFFTIGVVIRVVERRAVVVWRRNVGRRSRVERLTRKGHMAGRRAVRRQGAIVRISVYWRW